MSTLRNRKASTSTDLLVDNQDDVLVLEDGPELLPEHNAFLSNRRRWWLALRRAAYLCWLYAYSLGLLAISKLDYLASLFVGNRTHYVSDMPSATLGWGDRVGLFYTEHRRTAATVGAMVIFSLSLIYVLMVLVSIQPGSGTRAHSFDPLSSHSSVFEDVDDIPSDFSCPCRSLTGEEIQKGIVYQDVISEPAYDGNNALSHTSTRFATVEGVFAVNGALLDASHNRGCLIALPKIWRLGRPEDLDFVQGSHPFNPCVISIDTREYGRLEMVNPSLINEDPIAREGDERISMERVAVRESLKAFGFLVDGIEHERYRSVVVRFRTPPHLESIRMLHVTGVDALVLQSGIQMLRDGYSDVLRKVRGAKKRALQANPDLAATGKKLRFSVQLDGVSYEYDIN